MSDKPFMRLHRPSARLWMRVTNPSPPLQSSLLRPNPLMSFPSSNDSLSALRPLKPLFLASHTKFNIGPASSCVTLAVKTTNEGGSDNARICFAVDGKTFHASLPSAGGVERPNIVARNARARRGPRVTGFGVALAKRMIRLLWLGQVLLPTHPLLRPSPPKSKSLDAASPILSHAPS